MLIKRVGILYHPKVEATCIKAQELTAFLNSRGIKVWLCSAWEIEEAIANLDSTDLILTTGGDGTILRAAQVALQHQIPITGINMGKLGFMTEIKADEAVDQLPLLLDGKGWIDERAMLEAKLDPVDSKAGSAETYYALNDVVIARGAIAKLIQISTSINDQPLTTYRSDGIILATATGSTGYSLSAGGPILYPQSEDILLVPVVSHLSMDYSLVLPASSSVKLHLTAVNPATLSIDGHINIPVDSGCIITVRQSSRKTRFLRLHPQNSFYGMLEEKLRGKR